MARLTDRHLGHLFAALVVAGALTGATIAAAGCLYDHARGRTT